MTGDGIIGAKVRTVTLLILIALSIAAIGLFGAGTLQRVFDFHTIRILFQSIVWEAIPFIVIGVVISSLIETWVSPSGLASALGDSAGGRMLASSLGLVIPVCDCGAVSVARSLRRKGVSESVAFTFTLSTPTLNLVTLIATYVAFHQQWSWVFLRAGAALAVALLTGYVTRVYEDSLTEKWQTDVVNQFAGAGNGFARLRHATDHANSEIFAVGPFFVASALLAAIAQGFWPMHNFTLFTQHSLWSIPLLMGLGSVLSLCSEADAFVAASLTTLFSPGAVLAFMLMGQTVDLRNFMLMPRVFGKRTLSVGFAVATSMIFLIALATNRFFTGGWL